MDHDQPASSSGSVHQQAGQDGRSATTNSTDTFTTNSLHISPPPLARNVPPQPSVLSNHEIATGPSISSSLVLSADKPKKAKDGYWKMKEAEGHSNSNASTSAVIPVEEAPLTVAASMPTPSTVSDTTYPDQDPTFTSTSPSASIVTANPFRSEPPLPAHIPSEFVTGHVNKFKRRKPSPPPLMTTKGISLVFRMPPGTNNGNSDATGSSSAPAAVINQKPSALEPYTNGVNETGTSRGSTPDVGHASTVAENGESMSTAPGTGTDTGSGSKRKRRTEAPLNVNRPTRARRSSPRGSSFAGSPAPNGNSTTPANGNGALSIFAPPPPSDILPQAIQSAFGTSTATKKSGVAANDADPGSGPATDADAIRREAAAGFENRLRSRGQRRDGGERTGVSASGKDVRVGGTARTAAQKLDNSAASTSASAAGHTATTATTATSASKKKGKGKAEVDVPNQDFCSACRGIGRFLCCDGCPRSFHFMCLEPPLRIDELPDEETWYCKKCRVERLKADGESDSPAKEKELKPIPTVFKQLSKRVDDENPAQFRLPQDIRSFFTGVSTAARGEYVDAEEARTKYDRKGFQEERDPLRTRDGKSRPIGCYSCGGSSLPLHTLTTDPESTWRQIVTCDYCTLSWHLDCLDPPLASMPNSGRKWMCPNHAEQAIPRRRTVRNNLEIVDIDGQHQPNNGNIVVIPEPDPPKGPPLDYEDLVINRKKFRVPEKIIRLDFWAKVHNDGTNSTPTPNTSMTGDPPSQEEMDAANLVLSLLQPRTNAEVEAQPLVPQVQPNSNPDSGLATRGTSGTRRSPRNSTNPSSDAASDRSQTIPGVDMNANPVSNPIPDSNADPDSGSSRSANTHTILLSRPNSQPDSPPNLPQTQAQAQAQAQAKAETKAREGANRPEDMDVDPQPASAMPKIMLRMPGSGSNLNGR